MKIRQLSPLVFLPFLASCIQSDETRSIYVSADGRVDVVVFADDVRSAEKDAARAAKEEKEWLVRFKKGQTEELKKLRATGARGVKTVLLREAPPYSAVLRATYASVAAWGRLHDLNAPGGKSTVRLVREGKSRRLVFQVVEGKTGEKDKSTSKDGVKEKYPVWKFIPVGGRITGSRACVVDRAARSCILDLGEIERLDREGNGSFEFHIAWDL